MACRQRKGRFLLFLLAKVGQFSENVVYLQQRLCSTQRNQIAMEKKRIELRKLLEAVEKEVLRKPRQETLDHLALFAGYQDWDGFLNALHGDSEGLSNYEEGPLKYKGRQGTEPEKDK